MGIFILIGICSGAFLFPGMPWICGRWSRVSLKRKAEKFNALVLTFDDGPSSRLTQSILEILSKYNVKASFFLLGRNIEGRQHIVRRIAAEGHDVFSHGYAHLHYWKTSPFSTITDIRRGWKAIDDAIGIQSGKYPFRPPNGKINLLSLVYLLFRRVPIIYWTLDTGDTRLHKSKHNVRSIALSAQNAGGAVVLAHDYDRSDDSYATFVLESIQGVLEMAEHNDMHVMPVSELLNRVE